jgi:hypothetical protein
MAIYGHKSVVDFFLSGYDLPDGDGRCRKSRASTLIIAIALCGCTFSTPITGRCDAQYPKPYVMIKRNRDYAKTKDPVGVEMIYYAEITGRCE